MAFQPDSFQPDSFQADPPRPLKSALESLGRGAAQGATLGWGDEIQGVIQAGLGKLFLGDKRSFHDARIAERDAARKEDDRARHDHSRYYLAGQLAGGIAPSVLAAVTPVGAGVQGIASGAVGAAGESKAENAGGVAVDAALGGALGYGLGKLPGIVKETPGFLKDFARNTGRRFLQGRANLSTATKEPISNAAVDAAEAAGAIDYGNNIRDANATLRALRRTVGRQKGEALNQMEASGITGGNVHDLADSYVNTATDLANNSNASTRVPHYLRHADDLVVSAAEQRENEINRLVNQFGYDRATAEAYIAKNWTPSQVARKPVDAAGNLGLKQQDRMKRELQLEARNEYDKINGTHTPLGQTKMDLASKVRSNLENAIDQQEAKAPVAVADYRQAMSELPAVTEASRASTKAVAQALRRKGFTPTNQVSSAATAAGGVAKYGPKGALLAVPAAIGNKVAEEIGGATVSKAAYDAAKVTGAVNPYVAGLLEALRVTGQAQTGLKHSDTYQDD